MLKAWNAKEKGFFKASRLLSFIKTKTLRQILKTLMNGLIDSFFSFLHRARHLWASVGAGSELCWKRPPSWAAKRNAQCCVAWSNLRAHQRKTSKRRRLLRRSVGWGGCWGSRQLFAPSTTSRGPPLYDSYSFHSSIFIDGAALPSFRLKPFLSDQTSFLSLGRVLKNFHQRTLNKLCLHTYV